MLVILENRPGSGTYLATSSAKAPIEPFSIILSIKRGAILEILKAPESLEGTATEFVAQRRTNKDLCAMELALKEMNLCFNTPEKYSLYELEFHQAVIGAAKNRRQYINIKMAQHIYKVYGVHYEKQFNRKTVFTAS